MESDKPPGAHGSFDVQWSARSPEQRAHLALTAGGFTAWELDMTTGALASEDSLALLFGLTEPADTLEPYIRRLHPDDQTTLLEHLRRAAFDEPFRFRVRCLAESHQGYRWLLVLGEGMPAPDGSKHIIGYCGDITDRVEREIQSDLVLGELRHRSKNLIAVVQSISRATSGSRSVAEFAAKLDLRLLSLGSSIDLLSDNDWRSADLRDPSNAQLAHLADMFNDRVVIDGPVVQISAAATQSLSLVLHEMATNASKHGSLSTLDGRVFPSWEVLHIGGVPKVNLTWREEGGPEVTPPSKKGFGSRLVQTALGPATVYEFRSEGVFWHSMLSGADLIAPPFISAKSSGELP